jgi:ubiquinone biosynthesis protein UbiJ
VNLKDILGFAIESSLNAYLHLDPDSGGAMGEIDGRVIEFRLIGPDLSLFCIPSDGQIQVLTKHDGQSDAVVSATPLAFFRVGISGDPSKVVSNADVQFSGDLEVGRTFYDLLVGAEIEWEELLAGRIGDIAAHQIGNVVRDMRAWLGHTRDSLRMDLSEYLQEESQIVPTRTEVEIFMDGVDTLRSDVDRLQARLERLVLPQVEGQTGGKGQNQDEA